MINDLEELLWEQKGNEVSIKLPKSDGTPVNFRLNEKMINHIVSNIPRFVYIYIELTGENNEKCYFINFEKLKTTTNTSNSLKFTIGKPINKTVAENPNRIGRYLISRSESFQDRYLSEVGWQNLKKYFDIVDICTEAPKVQNVQAKIEAPEEIVPPPIEKKAPTLKAASSKLKECNKCGEPMPAVLDVCPYCKQSQVVEEDVIDISI